MEKSLHFGIKDLLRKVPYSWWPPKEYKLYQLGRFDLYPLSKAGMDPQKHLAKLPTNRNPLTVKTNMGVYHIKGLLSMREQQQVVETVRTWCIKEPQRYKFSRSEILAE